MLATVTVKGQITVPKAIRDKLNIRRGTQLDFTMNADGSLSVRPLERSALFVVGLLKNSASPAKSVDEMNEAVPDAAVERHRRASPPK